MLIIFNLLFNVDVRHLLCVWHIANDVENMVDKLCGGFCATPPRLGPVRLCASNNFFIFYFLNNGIRFD